MCYIFRSSLPVFKIFDIADLTFVTPIFQHGVYVVPCWKFKRNKNNLTVWLVTLIKLQSSKKQTDRQTTSQTDSDIIYNTESVKCAMYMSWI